MESELVQAINSITESINVLAQPRCIDKLAVGFSFLSIIVSGAAIFFAIRVANEQNKIALFEKRFAAYSAFLRFNKLSETLRSIEFQPQFNGSIKLSINEVSDEFIKNRTLLSEVLKNCLFWNIDAGDWKTAILQIDSYMTNFQLSIFSLIFLFKFDESLSIMENKLQEIFNNMLELIHLIFAEAYESNDRIEKANRIKIELTTEIDDFYQKYIGVMEKQLRVSKR